MQKARRKIGSLAAVAMVLLAVLLGCKNHSGGGEPQVQKAPTPSKNTGGGYFEINDGTSPVKKIEFPSGTGETLDHVFFKAEINADPTDAPDGKKFDMWEVISPDGSSHHYTTNQITHNLENTSDEKTKLPEFPFGTKINAMFMDSNIQRLTFKFTDYDGELPKSVRVDWNSQTDSAGVSWADIKTAAKKSGVNVELPAAPNNEWQFAGWKTSGSSSSTAQQYKAGETFTPQFKKEVTYTVYDGNENHIAHFYLYYGTKDGQTAKAIFAEAKVSDLDHANNVPSGKKFAGWEVSTSGAILTKNQINNDQSGEGATLIKSGALISPHYVDQGKKNITFTFIGYDYTTKAENPRHVQVTVLESENSAPWSAIKEAAGGNGSAILMPVPPSSYTFAGWGSRKPNDAEKKDATNKIEHNIVDDTLTYNTNNASTDEQEKQAGTIFYPIFTKALVYKVSKTSADPATKNVTVLYDHGEYTLKEIYNIGSTGNATVSNPSVIPNGTIFAKWYVKLPDGSIEKYTSEEINAKTETYPSGTSLYPFFANYGSGGATGDSETRSATTNKTPAVGDSITKKGKILSKGTPAPTGDEIIGYVYKVNTSGHVVHVVSNVIFAKTWAKTNSAAYNGKTNNGNILRANVPELESGYETWVDIRNWNPTALYENYPALQRALSYPRENATKEQIDAAINNNDYADRWYLPSKVELKEIYAAVDNLPTDFKEANNAKTSIKDKKLWSANMAYNGQESPAPQRASETYATKVENIQGTVDNWAIYVDFADGSYKIENKSVEHNCVAISQFFYK